MQAPAALLARRAFLQRGGSAAVGLAFSSIGAWQAQAATSSPVIETRQGRLRGSVRSDVAVFKGIRYAESTGGRNRFMPPVPAEPWAGVREALQFGHSAPQAARAYPSPMAAAISEWYSAIEPVDEDCLFLNVYAPLSTAGRKRPVMVWLHGGGWSTSSGTPPGTEGTELAARGDVVVVTLNHRLGVFGYLDLGTLDPAFADAGNAGVLDMVAALRWVRDNIEAFGGDAGNVTLFGQSGGAAKVTALLGLPAAQGLFQKAIVESCSGGLRVMPQAQAAQLAQTLSGKLGLSRPDPATLQALPMDALIAASRSMAEPFRPVLDHRNFLANPYDGTPSPLSPDVPVLIGNAATEATQFLVMNKANLEIGLPDICSKLAQFWRVDPARATGIVESFRQQMPASTTHFHLYAQIVTDYMYRRNTMQIAALKATQPAPVHAYVFDWKTPAFGGILLSPHTCEVPFVFGTTRQAAGLVGTGADLPQMTRRVMGAWAAFAHTGDPNSGDLPRWPRFAAPGKLAMLLDDQSHVESDPGGERRRLFEGLPYFEYGGLQVLMRG